MNGRKVLFVDDDPQLAQLIRMAFEKEKAQIETARDGKEAMRAFYTFRPELVLLDVRLPGTSGWELCQQMLTLADVPIIFLTASSSERDVIRGLELGAVDFVTKPFSVRVLIMRAKVALRKHEPEPAVKGVDYRDDYLVVDQDHHQITAGGHRVKLSAVEYNLLTYLLQNAGQVVSKEQILQRVWGDAYRDCSDYVHVYMSHLRKKLEPDPKRPTYLVTEHGFGYRFVKQSNMEAATLAPA